MIYLDYSATTPISDQALKVYNEVAKQCYGNANSLHDIGSTAEQVLEACRKELAKWLQVEERGIYFTSGGSESNALSIRSIIKANQHKGKHIITTKIEHSSVTQVFKQLEEEGYQVTYTPVDSYGRIKLQELEENITENTILASIGHANAELGTIQPMQEIGEILAKHNVIFHSDCVQSFGKIEIDAKKFKLDAFSVSSHKIYGPKGVGAVYISPHIRWKSALPGTTHEKGFRPGTLNVPGIASFTTAAAEAYTGLDKESQRMHQLSQQLLAALQSVGPVTLEGHPVQRLPHHLSLRIKGMEGQLAMLECNRHGLAISTGTACLAHEKGASDTLTAIGLTVQEASEFIRITLGKPTTAEEIIETSNIFERILQQYFKGKEVGTH